MGKRSAMKSIQKGVKPRNAQRSGCEGLLGVWLDCWVNRGCEKLKLFEGVAYVD